MQVKICGITNLEDALAACEAGADALGFVFYDKSPRSIDVDTAATIISKLPPFVQTVALFVNVSAQTVDEICKTTKICMAQIHFEPEKSFFDTLKVRHLKVVRASSKEQLTLFGDEYRIVDSHTQSYGGSGERLDLEWFREIDCSKIILAGGLNSENVAQAAAFGFYGVDVSSGVELSPGKKDRLKVAQFIKNAKSAVKRP